MPRRAHEPSDSEADVPDRGAAAVPGARPLKRRRTASHGPRGLVDVVQAGAHAGSNDPEPTPPRCPKGLSEATWTALLWEKKCSHCGDRTSREVDWGLRRRFCKGCQRKNVKSQVHMPKLYKGLSTDVFRLVPYSRVARSGIKTQYYWEPELEDVYNALKRLDERVKAGNPGASEERERYISERKRHVNEVLDAVHDCQKWQKQCQDRRAKAQAQLREKVIKSFVNMGYDVADVEDVFREARITEASVSNWSAFLKKYKPEMERRQRSRVTPIQLLHSESRRALKTHAGPARGWEVLVPFGDILAIPDVRSRLKGLSADNVADLAEHIPTFVDSWREDVEAQLLRTLPPPPKDVRKADAENPERLKLASSVWRRGDDDTPLTFPHMLLVPHVLCLRRKYGELEYATADGPWSMDDMEYDSVGAGVVREFCKLAFLNYSTATVRVLDHSALRLQCNLCRNAWPLVLTWRQAIKHLHEVHPDSGSGSWKPFPSTIAEPVATIEAGLEVWACAVSDCTRPHKLRKVAEIEKHLEEKHDVSRPIKGKHFNRAPTVPLSEPLNLLELYAESKENPMYECRRCGRSTSLDRMLEHLRDEHDVHLTSGVHTDPMAIDSEDDKPVPRGMKRHISISGSSSDEAMPPPKKRAMVTGSDSDSAVSLRLLQAPAVASSARALNQEPSVEDVAMRGVTGDVATPSSDVEDIKEDVLARLAHDPVGSKTNLKANNANKPETPASQYQNPSVVQAAPLPQFICMRCTRAIDRYRHMPHHSIVHHLALKHYIVDPVLRVDYSAFDINAQDLPAVLPWSLKKVYTCLLCKEHDEPATWSQVEHHLITVHKIVDPVAKRDFDGPSARDENAEDARSLDARPVVRSATVRPWESTRAVNHLEPSSEDDSETDDAGRSCHDGGGDDDLSEGDDGGESDDDDDDEDDETGASPHDEEPLTYAEARDTVRSYLQSRQLGSVDTCMFFCRHCPKVSGKKKKKKKSYSLNGVLNHLTSSRHSISRPTLSDFMVIQRGNLKCPGPRPTFRCLRCNVTKLFNENGMKNHLSSKHGYDDDDDFERHCRDTS